MQHIIIGNFGNHSIAALQYLLEQSIAPIYFLYVDTGWAETDWEERVEAGKAFAEQHQVHFVKLQPPKNFEELVLDRKQFPSPKFQWCVSFLKALPIIDYLDEIDPGAEATIVSGKRKIDGRRFRLLEEFPDDDAYFDGRRLWNPLVEMQQNEFKALIERAGFEFLPYPAKACSPCIHNTATDLSRLSPLSQNRLSRLESELNEHMFDKPIACYPAEAATAIKLRPFSSPTSRGLSAGSSDVERFVDPADKPRDVGSLNLMAEAEASTLKQQGDSLSQFDMGCGSPWGCGE